jgi:beta-alanine degradation protein BauB
MSMLRFVATLILLLAGTAHAADPIVTNPEQYEVLLANEHVRVLRHRDMPGDRTDQHEHPRFVLYAVGPFKRQITLPDGRVLNREFNGGEVIWSEAQTHIGENVGETPTDAIIVEVK